MGTDDGDPIAPMSRLQDYAQQHADRLLREIQELVSLESPSNDPERVNRAVLWMEQRLQAAGARTARVMQSEAGDQLIARLGEGKRRTLLLGHLDTVWEAGQLARMPVKVEEGKAYGPGIFDMKSGIVLMLELFRMASAGVCKAATSLAAFYNSDEETGSHTSRQALEQVASECSQVLVFEPPLPGGRVKTSRKGVGAYTLEVFGKAAHAGIDPAAGVSAIEEFAHQVFALRRVAEESAGASINIGVVRGGARSNIVAEWLQAEIDVRIGSASQGAMLDARLKSLQPALPGARIEVRGGINRPPLERSEALAGLFEKAAAVARGQGWTLREGGTGGASDGCFTAAMGIPTLDGLGPDGDGAHAIDEHLVIDDIPRRLALAAGLLESL